MWSDFLKESTKRSGKAKMLNFLIIFINFFQSAANEQNAQKIEAEADKAHYWRKLMHLFDFGHNLGYPVEHADSRQGQRNPIDYLKNRLVFTLQGRPLSP